MCFVESERVVQFYKARNFLHAGRAQRWAVVSVAASVVAVAGISGVLGAPAHEAPAPTTAARASAQPGPLDPIWG
jgi:hypothetical protein